MASGNVNIGFVDKRCSSRILKPPGGGYSDIFGTDDRPQMPTPRSKITQSRVHEILSTENTPNVKCESKQNPKIEENIVAKKLDETDSNGTEAEKQQKEEENGESKIEEGIEKLNVSSEENKSEKDSNENEQKNETNGSVAPNLKSPSKDSIQDIINENVNGQHTNGTTKTVVDNMSKQEVINTPRQKNRVPPGGYSSGLW